MPCDTAHLRPGPSGETLVLKIRRHVGFRNRPAEGRLADAEKTRRRRNPETGPFVYFASGNRISKRILSARRRRIYLPCSSGDREKKPSITPRGDGGSFAENPGRAKTARILYRVHTSERPTERRWNERASEEEGVRGRWRERERGGAKVRRGDEQTIVCHCPVTVIVGHIPVGVFSPRASRDHHVIPQENTPVRVCARIQRAGVLPKSEQKIRGQSAESLKIPDLSGSICCNSAESVRPLRIILVSKCRSKSPLSVATRP